MEPKANEQNAAADGDSAWQRSRMEIEEQWSTAVHGETPDRVPSKLPISRQPVRRAA